MINIKQKFDIFCTIISILILFSLAGCTPYKVKNYNLKSEIRIIDFTVTKIDSTESSYVYILKNDTVNAIVAKDKKCTPFKNQIKFNNRYQLNVKVNSNLLYKYYMQEFNKIYVDEKTFEFDHNMLLLDDCFNICGKTIK